MQFPCGSLNLFSMALDNPVESRTERSLCRDVWWTVYSVVERDFLRCYAILYGFMRLYAIFYEFSVVFMVLHGFSTIFYDFLR